MTYVGYRSNSRERKTCNSCNILTYVKIIRFSLLKKGVKISMNTQIKMTSQTCHWKQQVCETFSEKKPENVITLYHNAIN